MKLYPLLLKRLIVVILIQISLNTFSQNVYSKSPLESFLKNNGVKTMAQCAHVLNTFTEGSYSVDGNNITVEVNYRNGNSETIQFRYNEDDDYFDQVKSIAGEEMGYSFFMAKTLINAVLPTEREKDCMERFFHSTFENMSGEQLAAAILTNEWWKWKNKSCK